MEDHEKIGGSVAKPSIYASKKPPNHRHPLIRNSITDNESECKTRVPNIEAKFANTLTLLLMY